MESNIRFRFLHVFSVQLILAIEPIEKCEIAFFFLQMSYNINWGELWNH